MLKELTVALAISAFATTAAFAQTKPAEKTLTPQQQRMSTCSKDAKAKALKGDERKKFMSTCLKNKPAAATGKTNQQGKMTACNKEAGAKNMKGDARKAFMSTCLKG